MTTMIQDHPQGWRVVGGTFLLLLGGWSAVYAYAALAPAMAASLGIGEAALCLAYALAGGGCFLAGALSGPLADRIGARLPAQLGVLMVAVGLLLAAESDGFVAVALTFGLMVGIGVGLAYIPAMAAVQCCFTARRGVASGIAAMGIGAATLLVPMLAALLAPLGDWRTQVRIMAAGVLLLGLAGASMLPAAALPRGVADGPLLDAVRRSPAFRRLYLAVLLVSMPAALPFAWLPRSAEAAGLARPDALALLGAIGLGSMLGRVLLGHVADRIGRGVTLLACCVGIGLAMPVWAWAGTAALMPFALAFGAFQGGFVALCPAVTVDLFGRRSAAGASGLLLTGRGIALLVATPAVAQASLLLGEALPIAATGLCGLAGAALLHRVLVPARPRPEAVFHPV